VRLDDFVEMDITRLIGSVAAFCTTVSYFPQLKKCWATGQAGDLSFKMFSILAAGATLWAIYDVPRLLAVAQDDAMRLLQLVEVASHGRSAPAQKQHWLCEEERRSSSICHVGTLHVRERRRQNPSITDKAFSCQSISHSHRLVIWEDLSSLIGACSLVDEIEVIARHAFNK
jgi:uncharacterized protein with PQ loop repeat